MAGAGIGSDSAAAYCGTFHLSAMWTQRKRFVAVAEDENRKETDGGPSQETFSDPRKLWLWLLVGDGEE